MTERFKGTGSGKGDKSRIADMNKFARNMEKIYEKKSLEFWCVWEGNDPIKSELDKSNLKEGQQISYSEYLSRIIKPHKL